MRPAGRGDRLSAGLPVFPGCQEWKNEEDIPPMAGVVEDAGIEPAAHRRLAWILHGSRCVYRYQRCTQHFSSFRAAKKHKQERKEIIMPASAGGGGGGVRTHGHRIKNPMLYLLSYAFVLPGIRRARFFIVLCASCTGGQSLHLGKIRHPISEIAQNHFSMVPRTPLSALSYAR